MFLEEKIKLDYINFRTRKMCFVQDNGMISNEKVSFSVENTNIVEDTI